MEGAGGVKLRGGAVRVWMQREDPYGNCDCSCR